MDVPQVVNALKLIEFFAERQRPATLADVVRRFGWPRSSTHNLLQTLVNRGYLYEPEPREGFYPSPKWKDLAGRIEEAFPIGGELRATIERIASRTKETVVLGGFSGASVLFLDAIESPNVVRYIAPAGRRAPLHASATGRALLSLLAPEDRGVLLRKITFEQYTAKSPMSVQAVEREIARSIQRGWFESDGEYTEDLAGVAIPFTEASRPLAMLVAGPAARVRERFADLAATLVDELAATPGAQIPVLGRGLAAAFDSATD